MDERSTAGSLIERLAAYFSRTGESVWIGDDADGRWSSAGRSEVETALQAISGRQVRFDLSNAVKQRVLAPYSGSEARFEEWWASRAALLCGFDSVDPDASSVAFSVSHTARRAVAIVRSTLGQASMACGIDMEPADRPISHRVLSRIRSEQDRVDGLPGIGIWAAKEAVYKTGLGALTFREIVLQIDRQEGNFWTGASGELRIAIGFENGFVIAVAAV